MKKFDFEKEFNKLFLGKRFTKSLKKQMSDFCSNYTKRVMSCSTLDVKFVVERDKEDPRKFWISIK